MLMTHLDHGIALSPSTPQCNPDLGPRNPSILQEQKLKYERTTARLRHLPIPRNKEIGFVSLKYLLPSSIPFFFLFRVLRPAPVALG